VDACRPLFTTYAGNANDALALPGFTKDPSLDVTKGDLRLSTDRKSLVVTLSGPTFSPNLDPNVLPFGADASLIWDYAGTLYYAKATVPPLGGSPAYEAGTLKGLTFTPANSAVPGSWKDGTLTMTVPLADVGNPPAGARLSWPLGLVESQELGPVFLPIGLDTGADQDYVVGSSCVASKGLGKPTTKPTAVKKTGTTTHPPAKVTAPSGSLAATGVPAGLLGTGLLCLAGGLALTVARAREARSRTRRPSAG
jgi:hypothetical protein